MRKLLLLLLVVFVSPHSTLRCPADDAAHQQFHLVRECQRANTDDALALESTPTLEECMALARELRGLALNYAPIGQKRRINHNNATVKEQDARRRLSVFEQPGEFFNCHVLQCPQNTTFAGMLNDSRFDYYSLYGRPAGLKSGNIWQTKHIKHRSSTALNNISCIPQVGLFVVYTRHSSYSNASVACSNASEFSGSLAHIASERRTAGLAKWLQDYNSQAANSAIFLAYVGLQYNRSISLRPMDYRNAQRESLLCFLYSAWHAGHPRLGASQANASCVALTPEATWQTTTSCDYELPFICEIFTATNATQLDTGANAAEECVN
ncbi:hypothetical protein KR044_006266 [Drosophila immigrans]|nr:hypothetical protein KR044_006266 [Drosophila immigrans]